MRLVRSWMLALAAVSVFVLTAPLLRAQQGGAVVVAGPPGAGHVTKSADRPQGVSSPVPALLVSGHKVFLSNGGAEAGLFPHPFTGT